MADTAENPRQDASQQLDSDFIPNANETNDRDATHEADDSIDLPTYLGKGFLEVETLTEALAMEDTDLTMGPIERGLSTRHTMQTGLWVFGAINPPRDMVDRNDITSSGWTPKFLMKISVFPPAGSDPNAGDSIRVFVGTVETPSYRMLVKTKKVDSNDWKHHIDFWAWKNPGPDRVMVSVHERSTPIWRSRLEINRVIGDDPVFDVDWRMAFVFYVPRRSIRVFKKRATVSG